MMLSEVLSLVKKYYGLEGSKISSLGSCQDLNYKVTVVTNTTTTPILSDSIDQQVNTNPLTQIHNEDEVNKDRDVVNRVYVVKFTNPSVTIEDVHFQHQVKQYLQQTTFSQELLFPVPIPRIDDQEKTTVEQIDIQGQPYTLHLLTYLPGKLFDDFLYYPRETLSHFGEMIAKLCLVLNDYPLSSSSPRRQSEWDLRYAVNLCQKHLPTLSSEEEREKWLSIIKQVATSMESSAPSLRVQLVHGDLAPYNVVAGQRTNGQPYAKGIIDFGDVTESWLVGELAIAIVPFISKPLRHGGPLSPIEQLYYLRHILQGFVSVTPLLDAEVEALWPLIVLRTLSLYLAVEGLLAADPGNEYLREEAQHNRNAALLVTAIPLMVGIGAVKQAAGRHVVIPPLIASPSRVMLNAPAPSLDFVDVSPLSLFYQPGEWLDSVDCFKKLRDTLFSSAEGLKATECGSSWFFATKTRALDSPSTITSFSLVALPAGTTLSLPSDLLSVEEVLITEDWANYPVLQSWLISEDYKVVDIHFNEWTLRVAGPSSIVHPWLTTHSAPISSSSLKAEIVLMQAFRRSSSVGPLPAIGIPPLFHTATSWPIWRPFVLNASALLTGKNLHSLELVRGNGEEVRDVILQQRNTSLARCQEHYYRLPPQIERGYRTFLYDLAEGRAYLDLVNNVAILGHCHPLMQQVVQEQLQRLNTNSRFLYQALGSYAQHILETIPETIRSKGKLNKVFLVNSGSEATDLALRIARTVASERRARAAGQAYASSLNRHTLCLTGGYHGITTASDEVSTTLNDNPRSLETRADWIHLLPMPNLFRGLYRHGQGLSEEEIAHRYALLAKEKIVSLVERNTPPSVFIAEPLSGNAGGVDIPAGYLKEVYEAVREVGGLCICDEVQVGYGRLGNVFWGFQEHDVVPDLITMAKAAGNGHPLGFVITGEDIVADFQAAQGSFFSSAGGGPVSCRVGDAVLDVLQEDNLQENARTVGDYLHEKLLALQKKHPQIIGCIHGHGLYQGIELVRGDGLQPATEEAYAICQRLLELGVIDHNTGDYSNVLKVKPPLYFSHEDADFFVEALDIALQGW
eukprot:gene5586-6149_t